MLLANLLCLTAAHCLCQNAVLLSIVSWEEEDEKESQSLRYINFDIPLITDDQYEAKFSLPLCG